jgi:hypothetical protein
MGGGIVIQVFIQGYHLEQSFTVEIGREKRLCSGRQVYRVIPAREIRAAAVRRFGVGRAHI